MPLRLLRNWALHFFFLYWFSPFAISCYIQVAALVPLPIDMCSSDGCTAFLRAGFPMVTAADHACLHVQCNGGFIASTGMYVTGRQCRQLGDSERALPPHNRKWRDEDLHGSIARYDFNKKLQIFYYFRNVITILKIRRDFKDWFHICFKSKDQHVSQTTKTFNSRVVYLFFPPTTPLKTKKDALVEH